MEDLFASQQTAYLFADGNGVSFGTLGSTVTATVKTDYQTAGAYLTTAALSQDSSKYAGTAGAITGGSITVNTAGVSVNLPAYITTAMASNRGSDFVAATAAFAGTSASGTIASNGISISIGPYITTAMASNRGSDFVQANATIAGTSISGTIASNGFSLSVGPYLTTAALSGDTTKYAGVGETVGTVAGTDLGLTVNTDGVSIKQGNWLTTAMASNRGSDFVQANATIAGTSISGTIASNGFSLSVGPYLTTAALSQDSSKYAFTGFTSTTTSGVDIKATHNTQGLSMAVPAYLTTADLSANSSNYAGVGETVGTVAGTDIAITMNTAGLSLAYPKAITTAALSGDTTKYAGVGETVGTIAGTDMAMTVNTDGVSLAYPKAITTARGSTDAVGLNTALTANGVAWTVNSSGISLNIPAFLTTAMASNRGSDFVQATAGFNGTGVSGTIASNSISVAISAIKAFGASNTGNTAGNTGVSTGVDWVIAGSNAVTVSQSTVVGGPNTLWLSAGNTASTFQGGISTGGHTAGSTGVVDQRIVFVGTNGITLSGSTDAALHSATITIRGPSPHLSYYRFWDPNNTLTFSFAQSTSYVAPGEFQENHSFDRFRVVASGSVAASSTQATVGGTSYSMSAITSHNIVVYSRGGGASSLSLQYVTSTQVVDQCLMTMSINANSTQYSVSLRYSLGSDSLTKDYSISNNSLLWHTSNLTDLTGMKYLDLPMAVSLSPGQYWFAYGRSTTFATGNAAISVATRMLVSHNSMIGISQNTLAVGMLGGNTNSSVGWLPGHGSFTTSGAAGTTSSVGLAVVSTTASNIGLYGQLMRIV